MKLTGKIAAWFWMLLLLGNIGLAYLVLYSKASIWLSSLGLFLFGG